MVIHHFDFDASTSVANLTDNQVAQLCAIFPQSNGTLIESAIRAATSAVSAGENTHDLPFHTADYMRFIYGLISVTLISLCAVVGIGVMRYMSKHTFNQIITYFVGLGVGSLAGSSFFHLLPQAHPQLVQEVDANGNLTHNYLTASFFSILGVFQFFTCDRILKVVLEKRKKGRVTICDDGDDGTQRSDAGLLPSLKDVVDKGSIATDLEMVALETSAGKSMGDQPSKKLNLPRTVSNMIQANSESWAQSAHGVCVHDHSMTFEAGDSAIAAVAWMIIFGDGLHNLIDGISIGASFAESMHSGLSVSIAVFCEEFPHELGDVAILVAAGMTLRQALLYNLLSCVTCYIGFVFGFFIGEMDPSISKTMYAFAGGMFLYISLACMMPEMKKAMEEALNVSLRRGLYVLFLQTTGLISGLLLMYVMARYGEEITI